MYGTLSIPPSIFWVTGLSGAGKTTFARVLVGRLRAKGETVVLLDGDDLREVFGATGDNGNYFDRASRLALAMRYAHLSRVVSVQGIHVVIATISLFREVHAWNRANLPGYCEIYLKVPLEELRRRDPKGIYKRFDAGALENVAGLDMPVDVPESPDWTVHFENGQEAEKSVDEFLNYWQARE